MNRFGRPKLNENYFKVNDLNVRVTFDRVV